MLPGRVRLFNRLLSRYPAAYVVPWVLLGPVVAMASSWALLGEAPGAAELAGAALLVIGVLAAEGIVRRPSTNREIQNLSQEEVRPEYVRNGPRRCLTDR